MVCLELISIQGDGVLILPEIYRIRSRCLLTTEEGALLAAPAVTLPWSHPSWGHPPEAHQLPFVVGFGQLCSCQLGEGTWKLLCFFRLNL